MQESTLEALCKLIDTLPFIQTAKLLEHISHKIARESHDLQVNININKKVDNEPKNLSKYCTNEHFDKKIYGKKIRTPYQKNRLDCTLDELVETNMDKRYIFQQMIFDWESVNGDLKCPRKLKKCFCKEIEEMYPMAKGTLPTF